jgi:replicative DNA helicase
MAQIIIAKHRKGATGDVLLTFRGQFTRFENPEDSRLRRPAAQETPEGEIRSSINSDDNATYVAGQADTDPFIEAPADGEVPF